MEARLSGLSSLLLALLISAYAPPAACMRERTQLIHHHAESSHEELRALYVDTLKKSVTGILLETPGYVPELMAEKSQLELRPFQLETRIKGEDWPVQGLSMVGLKRLDNLEMLLRRLEAHKVTCDLIECGVWRGGVSLFMRGLLKAHGITNRTVHLVDSFDGLPKASTDYDEDTWRISKYLKIPLPIVQGAFERYGLLDSQVQFHKSLFRESLPAFRTASTSCIALLRMDGDMYESTIDILYNLVDLMSLGACIVVDDKTIPFRQRAVKDFWDTHAIAPTIHAIDAASIYFCLEDRVSLDTAWYNNFNAKRIQ